MLRRKKDWKKQWYVLKEKVLYRYKACEDMAALESMPLLGYEIQLLTEVRLVAFICNMRVTFDLI